MQTSVDKDAWTSHARKHAAISHPVSLGINSTVHRPCRRHCMQAGASGPGTPSNAVPALGLPHTAGSRVSVEGGVLAPDVPGLCVSVLESPALAWELRIRLWILGHGHHFIQRFRTRILWVCSRCGGCCKHGETLKRWDPSFKQR